MNTTILFWHTIITLAPAPSGMDALSAKITALATAITPIAWPILTISIIVVCLAAVASPILPEWANGMKGTVIKACLAAVMLTAVPIIVAALQTASAVGS